MWRILWPTCGGNGGGGGARAGGPGGGGGGGGRGGGGASPRILNGADKRPTPRGAYHAGQSSSINTIGEMDAPWVADGCRCDCARHRNTGRGQHRRGQRTAGASKPGAAAPVDRFPAEKHAARQRNTSR